MSGWEIIGLVAALTAAMIGLGVLNKRRDARALREKLQKSFGGVPDKKMSPERYACVPGYYRHHRQENQIDDITWNDLDLDLVYRRIDAAASGAGEEFLYWCLRTPALDASQEHFSEEDLAFAGDPANWAVRVRLQEILTGLGSTGKYSLYDFLEELDTIPERGNAGHFTAMLAPLFAIGVMVFHVQAGVLLLIAVLVLNMVTYFRERSRIGGAMDAFRYLLRAMAAGDEIRAVSCGAFAPERKRLTELSGSFRTFRRFSGLVMSEGRTSGNPLDIFLDYFRILTHCDLIKFNTMLRQTRLQRDGIDELETILGKIDASIAVASYRKSLPVFCVPEFTERTDGTTASLSLKGVIHPLLTHPVANDVTLSGPMLLTGSNASGKSTFLRAVSLALLLGQTIRTAAANSCRAPYYRIYTSMALRDSIVSGESYFMAEIHSLKRILDAAKSDVQAGVYCCVDEVLRGTNTIERIAASTELLKALADEGVLCLAATHDIELTGLLEGTYANYHFEEEIVNGDVRFSYRLYTGKASTRNAILLLAAAGFDPGLTKRARERAERFETTGRWES